MIAAGLEKKNGIYGFHFFGNYSYVDSKRCLIFYDHTTKVFTEIIIMHLKHRISGD